MREQGSLVARYFMSSTDFVCAHTPHPPHSPFFPSRFPFPPSAFLIFSLTHTCTQKCTLFIHLLFVSRDDGIGCLFPQHEPKVQPKMPP